MSHVLILTLVFPPDGVSTAQIVGDLALDLQSRGHDVTVVTTTPHYNRDDIARARQPLTRFWGRLLQRSEYSGIITYHILVPQKGRSVVLRLFGWAVFHVMSTIVSAGLVRRPDVILAPSPPLTIGVNAWVIGLLRRCPYIYNVQEIYPDIAVKLGALQNRRAISLLLRLERFVYDHARFITVIGPSMRRSLEDKGVPPAKLSVIPNGVDVASFSAAPRDNDFARKHGLQDRFVVTYAGNMGPSTGLETVIDAAELLHDLPELAIMLIGGGIRADDIRALVERRQLRNVHMLPHHPYEFMSYVYGSSDVCLALQAGGTGSDVLPSKVYRIMAFGRPIVATADPDSDLARLIEEADCGAVVPPGDPEAMAAMLRHSYVHQAEWRMKGISGRACVERHYARASTSARYDELIRAAASA